ncbi:MAG: hypothetical protein KBG48_27285 [Kofleriaceae bacterium]|jgi:hypothetical protein|nr:hypothetical protein [Kofleriaceae bacterium]MBP9171133.1 hypothetical protein [Kofleriaceae bacterium]MBP9863455.1 hypothetical protein [Kofleriaceae bacterium]
MTGRWLVAPLAMIVALVIAPPVADACRCRPPAPAKAAAGADVVFVGTVTAVDAPAVGRGVVGTVAVDRVWKGQVGTTVSIHDSPTSCGRGLTAGERLIVMARRDGDRLTVRQCDGTQRATAKVERLLTRRLGAPRAPS